MVGIAVAEAVDLSQLTIEESDLVDPAALDHTPTPAPRTIPQTNPVLRASTGDDDLIPSGDPSHNNLRLRNLSVDLLQRLTARTILGFVLSLLEGEDLASFPSTTRPSIIKAVQNNRDSFARISRSETQLIIGECLLDARSNILSEYENEAQADCEAPANENENHQRRTLDEILEEKRVSGAAEERLTELIKNQFTDYAHPFRNPCDHQPPLKRSISLAEAASLISFSAQVFSWNKLFELLFSTA